MYANIYIYMYVCVCLWVYKYTYINIRMNSYIYIFFFSLRKKPLKIAVLGKSLPIKKNIYLMILIKKKNMKNDHKIEKEKLYGLTSLFVD